MGREEGRSPSTGSLCSQDEDQTYPAWLGVTVYRGKPSEGSLDAVHFCHTLKVLERERW